MPWHKQKTNFERELQDKLMNNKYLKTKRKIVTQIVNPATNGKGETVLLLALALYCQIEEDQLKHNIVGGKAKHDAFNRTAIERRHSQ